MSAEPKRVELTEAERGQLFAAGDHHPDMCDCTGYVAEVGYAPDSEEVCEALVNTFVVVERIKAAAHREGYRKGYRAAVSDQIAALAPRALAEPEHDEEGGIVASVTKPTEYEETQP